MPGLAEIIGQSAKQYGGTSWWGDYQNAVVGGKDALANWMNTQTPNYKDWSPGAADFASRQLASMQDNGDGMFGIQELQPLRHISGEVGRVGGTVGAGLALAFGAAEGAGALGAGAGAGAEGMSAADAAAMGTMTEGGGVAAGAGATAAVEGAGTTAAANGGFDPFALNAVEGTEAWSGFPSPSSGSSFEFPFNSNAGMSSPFDTAAWTPSGAETTTSGGWEDYWKQAKPWLRGAGGALSIGSGIMNMINSRKMANAAQGMRDPHQDQYRDQLAQLQAHPESVKDMPGYQFGMDEGRLAIQRQGAAGGSGGNEAIALARYTPQYAQNFYQQQFKNLAALSEGNPGAQLTGQALANQMANQSLWQLGWGANTFLGKD